MRSKLTKTIILIVFVVFLGIKNVSAVEDCYYHTYYSSTNIDVFLHIKVRPQGGGEVVEYYSVDYLTGERTDRISSQLKISDSITSCTPDLYLYGNDITLQTNAGTSADKFTQISSPDSSPNRPFLTSNVSALERGDSKTTSCGSITDIPSAIPRTTKIIYLFLQVLIPVVLIIMGMLDLMKAVMAQKEDEIKRGQQTLVKRLIAAAIVFFVFALVKMLVSFVSDGNTTVIDCLDCFISGECDDSETPDEGEGSSSTTALEWNESSDAQIAMVS